MTCYEGADSLQPQSMKIKKSATLIASVIGIAASALTYFNRPAVAQPVAKPVVVAAPVRAPAPVAPAAVKRMGPIIIAPAPNGDLDKRWRCGPNAQTALTAGASWK